MIKQGSFKEAKGGTYLPLQIASEDESILQKILGVSSKNAPETI